MIWPVDLGPQGGFRVSQAGPRGNREATLCIDGTRCGSRWVVPVRVWCDILLTPAPLSDVPDGDSTRAVVSGYGGDAVEGVKIDQIITYLTWLTRHIVAIVRSSHPAAAVSPV
jgi:hypothetical protein